MFNLPVVPSQPFDLFRGFQRCYWLYVCPHKGKTVRSVTLLGEVDHLSCPSIGPTSPPAHARHIHIIPCAIEPDSSLTACHMQLLPSVPYAAYERYNIR